MLLVNSAATVLCTKVNLIQLLAAAHYLLAKKYLAKAGALLTTKKLNFFLSQEALSGLGPQCFFYARMEFSKSQALSQARQTKFLRNRSRNPHWLAICVC